VVDGSPVRTVVENGPVRVSVKVTRSKSNTNYTHFYRLCADSAGSLVTVDNRFNWNSRGNLLKAAFYLNVSADSAIYSVGVGTIKRPVSGTDKRYENPHQQWQTITDGTSGVAIIDHYKYGSSSLAKNNLMLTLVHSPGSTNWSTEGENRYPFNFSYAVYGYAGNWNKDGQVETQTQRFQMPLRGFQVAPHAGTAACGKQFSFVKVGDPSKIMIMALKKAGKTDKPESNSDYVVRVREISGSGPSSVKLLFGYDILSAKETNGMEDDSGAVDLTPGGTSNNEIAFSINRFQIKTFKVSLGTTYVQGATGIHSRGLVPGAIVSSEESAFTVKFAAHGRLISAKFPLHGGELVRSVSITNMAGRLVRKLHSGPKMLAAASTLMWDGRYKGGVIVPPGVYVINVKTNQSDKCAKLQFIR
ncbi:MAG: hypothetical protein MUF22_07120, partial [Chitinispirillaceae bacterium]|jgi:alpha-mannosidase|nr:hypothetical protein [Chitinispirillaceae bacterium]